MKILSRFKDYYDFVAGHDTDPRKVYIRAGKYYAYGYEELPNAPVFDVLKEYSSVVEWTPKNKKWFQGVVLFCNKLYPYLHDLTTDEFYFSYDSITKEEVDLFDEATLHQSYRIRGRKLKKHFGVDKKRELRWGLGKVDEYIAQNKFNSDVGEPVIFSAYDPKAGYTKFWFGGKLQDIGFASVVPPQQAFTDIYNFLPYNEPKLPDDPTDMQRFEGKGL